MEQQYFEWTTNETQHYSFFSKSTKIKELERLSSVDDYQQTPSNNSPLFQNPQHFLNPILNSGKGQQQLEDLITAFVQEKGIDINSRANTQPDSIDELSKDVPTIGLIRSDRDIIAAKSELMDLLFCEVNMFVSCQKVLHFLCKHLGANVGAVYLDENTNFTKWTVVDSYPSMNLYSSYFNWETGYQLVLEAALKDERLENQTSLDNGVIYDFLFVPVKMELSSQVAVIVLGSHNALAYHPREHKFLLHVLKIISNVFDSLAMTKKNALLIERLEMLEEENKNLLMGVNQQQFTSAN
eukprot:TRINITY_DN14068_c0_g1_i1.p1 TRINITY_DN14068_c0_g1~~TRINITY_DN14068_c0_g1_i1.p1  ORF type:complete len:319 (-),score=61.11 TRINITY_DN14068_c0_g1_i1:235-1125(-)